MAEEVSVYMYTKVLITKMLLISVIQYHPPLEDSKFRLVQYWKGKIYVQNNVSVACSNRILTKHIHGQQLLPTPTLHTFKSPHLDKI